jgi:hypothetical protein
MIARILPRVLADRAQCRTALLRGLEGPHDRVDFILDGLQQLELDSDDEPVFRAA